MLGTSAHAEHVCCARLRMLSMSPRASAWRNSDVRRAGRGVLAHARSGRGGTDIRTLAPKFAPTFAGRPAQIRRFCWLLGDGGQFMGTVIAPPAVLAPAASAAVAPVVSAAAPLAAMASATSTAVVSAGASPAVLSSATSAVVVSAAAPPAALPPVVLPWRPTPAALCDS